MYSVVSCINIHLVKAVNTQQSCWRREIQKINQQTSKPWWKHNFSGGGLNDGDLCSCDITKYRLTVTCHCHACATPSSCFLTSAKHQNVQLQDTNKVPKYPDIRRFRSSNGCRCPV